ncbi:hypothetical protein LWI29_024726 [Acer saccharum]|uniref:RNase H type-1 domain-containing protein n=1 Tax=Acer saccharum TaxID=4024 RepID=A0AA39RY62_ACESA|nr:hypothetical protein LWI29_024726 [Acer saccharum]
MVAVKEILEEVVQERFCVPKMMILYVLRLWEGVGDTTSNAAEYRAVILGLKYALDYNFEHICVQGDSMIVCKQIPGEWQVRNENLSILCEEARQLKDQFVSFEIEHIHRSGILNFDGCSKGNPGKAGAGAVLRPENGSWVLRLREGVGRATNNVAEYQALILGLRYALDYGFTHIRVQGDSLLVCKQESNTAADTQANLGLHLRSEALQDTIEYLYSLKKVKSKPGGLRCFDASAEGEVETRQGYVVLMLT